MKSRFVKWLRPGPRSRFRTSRSAKVRMKDVFYGVLVLFIFILIAPFLAAGISSVVDVFSRDGDDEWTPVTDDGIYTISKWRVAVTDFLNENAAVTPDLARALMPDGSIVSAVTLASGYAQWENIEIKEGQSITVEIDSSSAHYPQMNTWEVGDINSGTYDNTYYGLGTAALWGMDGSSDAGVVLVTSGVYTLFNGSLEEDQLAVDAGLKYNINIVFDWNAADEEYWGVQEYTQLADNEYTYVPVIKITGSTGVMIDAVSQGSVKLQELYNVDNGDSLIGIYQIIPMRENEDVDADGIYIFTFDYTPDGASGDTLDITFHDETRKDRAESGATSQATVETVAQLTTT